MEGVKTNTAVAIRREMVKIPSVMETLAPVERSVFLASTETPFAEYDAKELSLELGRALVWIAKDVGYRVNDDGEMGYLVIRLVEILKLHYATLSIRDFKMAFQMSLTGELDEHLPRRGDGQPDRGHYQNFNVEYVCKILNAYRQKRAAILNKAHKQVPQRERTMDANEILELQNRTKQDCIDAFDFYRTKGRLPDMSPIAEMLYYQLLSDAGLAPEIVVTMEEQKAILQRTINAYARKGMVGDVTRLKSEGHESKELSHGSFVLARRRNLENTFKRMVEQGVEITDYIKIEQ